MMTRNIFEENKEKRDQVAGEKRADASVADKADIQDKIESVNDSISELKVQERTDALRQIEALEERSGINTDRSEGVIAKQIRLIKEAGTRFHSRSKNLLGLRGYGNGRVDSGTMKLSEQEGKSDLKRAIFHDSEAKETSEYNIEKAKEYAEMIRTQLMRHIQRPEYLDKLKLEFNGNEAKAVDEQKVRAERVRTCKIMIMPVDKINEEFKKRAGNTDSEVNGFYTPSEHMAYAGPFDHDTIVHELLHAATIGNVAVSKKAEKLLSASYEKSGLFGIFKKGLDYYYSDPTEMLVRKQMIDRELEMLGVKKYGEKFTDEHLDKLLDCFMSGKLSFSAEQFILRMDFDNFKRIFNEIAANEVMESQKAA